MAGVTFDRVSKIYADGTRAVNEMDLEIQDGEFMVLVGPSGCGKSTALRMVAGLEEISEGVLKIGDRVVNHVPPRDRDIAMVFQSYALYPHLSVYENIAFGLRVKNVPKDEVDKRVQDAARILGLEQFLKRKPRALSGGQRQRVAMGRAIVRQPAAFLMDEPLSNLDAKLRVAMRAEISRLQGDLGTTTVYVTHDQVEAMTMGDRIAVMRQGVLQQVGTPQELYTDPNNVFVARFIGSPSMNIVPVEPSTADGRAVLQQDGFQVELPERVASGLAGDNGFVVGFRPEHVRLASEGSADSDVRIPAVADVVEYLGDEQLVHLHAGEVKLVAKLPIEQRVRAGEDICLTLPPSRLHLFDRQNEQSIAIPGA